MLCCAVPFFCHASGGHILQDFTKLISSTGMHGAGESAAGPATPVEEDNFGYTIDEDSDDEAAEAEPVRRSWYG